MGIGYNQQQLFATDYLKQSTSQVSTLSHCLLTELSSCQAECIAAERPKSVAFRSPLMSRFDWHSDDKQPPEWSHQRACLDGIQRAAEIFCFVYRSLMGRIACRLSSHPLGSGRTVSNEHCPSNLIPAVCRLEQLLWFTRFSRTQAAANIGTWQAEYLKSMARRTLHAKRIWASYRASGSQTVTNLSKAIRLPLPYGRLLIVPGSATLISI